MTEPNEGTDFTEAHETPGSEPFRVDAPGIYFMSADDYHADPCPVPSLSSSIAHTLCNDAPVRAWYKHPRLNPAAVREQEDRFVIGTAAHSLVLEGNFDRCRVIDGVDDYKTKAAQAARDEALAANLLPMLRKHFHQIVGMHQALRQQLDIHYDGKHMLRDGEPEAVLIWIENVKGTEVWCRARLDYLRRDVKVPGIDDYKTTKGSANPDQVAKNIATSSMLMQSTFYRRGALQALGDELPFRFVVQECEPPYLLSVNAAGPSLEDLGRKQLAFALETWAACLELGVWPTYGTSTAYASLPPWVEEQWLAKELREEVASGGL